MKYWSIGKKIREVKVIGKDELGVVINVQYLDDGNIDQVSVLSVYSDIDVANLIKSWNLTMEKNECVPEKISSFDRIVRVARLIHHYETLVSPT